MNKNINIYSKDEVLTLMIMGTGLLLIAIIINIVILVKTIINMK